MEKFRTVTYEVHNPKIKNENGVRFAFLADFHGSEFGKNNSILIEKIRKWKPDAILIAGDMVVRKDVSTLKKAEELLKPLAAEFPVFYSPGNHESKMKVQEHVYHREYLEYEKSLKENGVRILANETCIFQKGADKFRIYGLELPLEYYKKPFSPGLSDEKIEQLIGKAEPREIDVLLAHCPKYGKTYFNWGADLILSGHYHGGVLRFSRHIGAISSQFIPFPKYCCGDFYRENQCMLVSAGLGEHTVPLRIHNPRELIFIEMKK